MLKLKIKILLCICLFIVIIQTIKITYLKYTITNHVSHDTLQRLMAHPWYIQHNERNNIINGRVDTHKLEFEPSTISGNDACNTFNGKVTIDGNKIKISDIMKTEAFCWCDTSYLAPYNDLTSLLEDVQSFEIKNHRHNYVLILFTQDKSYTFSKNKPNTKEIRCRLIDTSNPSIKSITPPSITPIKKESTNVLRKPTINNARSIGIKLDSGKVLFIPDLEKPLLEKWEMYQDIVYMTDIQPIHEYASLYSGEIVSVATIRFEPSMVFGRPLRDNVSDGSNKFILPTVIKSQKTNWTYNLSQQLLDEINTVNDKQAFINHWCNVAQHECSSIDSFEQVIKELEHYGAPEWIVLKTHKARLDEIKHTKMALSLANAVSNNRTFVYDLEPFKCTIVIRSREQFLAENYQDACIGEAEASQELSKQALVAYQQNKPHLSALLNVISTDEAMHAELGYDINKYLSDIYK